MNLEIKHLAPYLPYQLKLLVERQGKFNNEANITQVEDWKMQDLDAPFGKRYRVVSCKPLLIPLHQSDNFGLLYSIVKSETSSLPDYLDSLEQLQRFVKGRFPNGFQYLQYRFLEDMFKNHIDVFSLIPAGLALNKLDHI